MLARAFFKEVFILPYSTIHWTFLLPATSWSSTPWETFALAIFPIQLDAGNTGYLKILFFFPQDFLFQLSRPSGLWELRLDKHLNCWAFVQAAATSVPIVAWPPLPQPPALLSPAFHCLHGYKWVFLQGCGKEKQRVKRNLIRQPGRSTRHTSLM